MTTSSAHTGQQSARRTVFLPSLFWSRNRPDFYAVTCRIGADGIEFRSAVVPGRGERLTCSIGHVGIVEVQVAHAAENTFTVRPVAGRQRNAAVARTLLDLAGRQSHHPDRHGATPRIVPRRSEVSVTLADGTIVKGRLAEVSISGANVYLGVSIEVGTKIRLGSTDSVVAQTFGNGIGAYFLSPLDPDVLSEGLVL